MGETARGGIKARPIPIGRRMESHAEADYHTRRASIIAMQMMANDAQDVISRIMNHPGYDEITKINLINKIRGS